MLKYLRNKVVSVDKISTEELKVHGILDDDMYALEMEAVFSLEELEIRSISGKWNRWTTPECQRAVNNLNVAVGFRVEPGFRTKVQKTIGRGACRHFANLLLEMGHAAKSAALTIGFKQARENNPNLSREDYLKKKPVSGSRKTSTQKTIKIEFQNPVSSTPDIPEWTPGDDDNTVIDLHVHTFPASPCSSITVDEIITEAKTIGLGGIVLTDHNHLWKKSDIENLRQKHGFLVLGGNEIITDQGDVLVYGLDIDIQGVIKLSELSAAVKKAEGYMVMAHPFRGFLIFDAQELGLTVEKAAERDMFKMVNALEILNGKVTPEENQFAKKVTEKLGLAGAAGSDAHEVGSVGTYATAFSATIKNEKDLVEALHSAAFHPVLTRKQTQKG